MSGRNSFSKLKKDFSPERKKRIDEKKAGLRAEMPLYELRQARAMTQKALSEALNVNQPAIAKIERRADMYVSNLRSYVEAMGGELKIIASFPEGDVAIKKLEELD